MRDEKRHYHRVRLSTEVGYRVDKTHLFGGCIAKDISENGIRIWLSEFISPGTMMDLEFKLPLSQRDFVVRARVVWILKLSYNEQWEAGLQMYLDHESLELIKHYVSLQKSEPPPEF